MQDRYPNHLFHLCYCYVLLSNLMEDPKYVSNEMLTTTDLPELM